MCGGYGEEEGCACVWGGYGEEEGCACVGWVWRGEKRTVQYHCRTHLSLPHERVDHDLGVGDGREQLWDSVFVDTIEVHSC